MCKSAPRSRQITTPAPHHSVFYRPDALPAAQPTASKHWRHYTVLHCIGLWNCVQMPTNYCNNSIIYLHAVLHKMSFWILAQILLAHLLFFLSFSLKAMTFRFLYYATIVYTWLFTKKNKVTTQKICKKPVWKVINSKQLNAHICSALTFAQSCIANPSPSFVPPTVDYDSI